MTSLRGRLKRIRIKLLQKNDVHGFADVMKIIFRGRFIGGLAAVFKVKVKFNWSYIKLCTHSVSTPPTSSWFSGCDAIYSDKPLECRLKIPHEGGEMRCTKA
jgi:hypothetical protein